MIIKLEVRRPPPDAISRFWHSFELPDSLQEDYALVNKAHCTLKAKLFCTGRFFTFIEHGDFDYVDGKVTNYDKQEIQKGIEEMLRNFKAKAKFFDLNYECVLPLIIHDPLR